jgi:hypothetical protein
MELSAVMNIGELAANWKQKNADFSLKVKEGHPKGLPKGSAAVYGMKNRIEYASQHTTTEQDTRTASEVNPKRVDIHT